MVGKWGTSREGTSGTMIRDSQKKLRHVEEKAERNFPERE